MFAIIADRTLAPKAGRAQVTRLRRSAPARTAR